MNFDLRHRKERIFFFYKFYLFNFTKEQGIAEIHQDTNIYHFTSLQEQTIFYILDQQKFLEKKIKDKLRSWNFDRLDILERAILLNGTAEMLLFNLKKAIVINEAVNFSKEYCKIDAHKFINGILEAIEQAPFLS